jgi:hypothetical protein
MAICEFHGKYADYLTDRIASELVGREDQGFCDLGKVLCVVNAIDICKNLEQITPGEAGNLTSIVFKLYPQFEEEINAELSGFGGKTKMWGES